MCFFGERGFSILVSECRDLTKVTNFMNRSVTRDENPLA